MDKISMQPELDLFLGYVYYPGIRNADNLSLVLYLSQSPSYWETSNKAPNHSLTVWFAPCGLP